MEEQSWLKQYGLWLLIGLLLAALVLGRQLFWAGGLFGNALQPETAVSPQQSLAFLPTLAAVVPIEEDEIVDTAVILSGSLPIPNENSLAPAPNPRTFQAKMPSHQFPTYEIQPGDTPNIIADKHDISPETLLGGNPQLNEEANQLQAGTEIVILPVDGVLHTVRPGETLEQISAQYEIPVSDIIEYPDNNLEFPYRLQPETQLMVPGAKIGRFYWTPPKSVPNNGQWAVVGTGTYVWPVQGRCVTNYYWLGHAGLDIGLTEGSAVNAADRGTVTYASWASGTYYDYGNLIVINHGNGIETFYAHLNSIGVSVGQIVQQGEWVGSSGNTGRSSGPHIHIEIRQNDFPVNPLIFLGGPTTNCT